MTDTVQTAVVGVTGYAGAELARLLLHHPRLKGTLPVFAGRMDEKDSARGGIPLADIHPQLSDNNGTGALRLEPFSWELLAERGVKILFLATPHEQSRKWVPQALAHGMRVIDLSGAWRLNEGEHRAVYGFEDDSSAQAIATQAQAVYGMPELHRAQIAGAHLVANPGCYATSVILALRPLVAAGLVDLGCGIVADSKSGVSGAGKAPTSKTHYMYAADNLSAYGVFSHRHTGELLEQIGVSASDIIFTPHLLPIPRGILSTIYVRFRETQTRESIAHVYREFFAGSPMVRLYDNLLPQIQYSVRTNYADIGFQLASDGHRAVIVSCLDNLLKGASGQAVQNLNVMLGWGEAEGARMKYVVKLGGAGLETPSLLEGCTRAIADLVRDGHQVVVVHGGGAQLTRMLKALGKQSEFVAGLRITDAETRDVALMVLAGKVNKGLVAALGALGQPAVGLSGGDGLLFRARKKRTVPDLGYVGEIASSDPRWIEAIWKLNGVPVISSMALGFDGEYYNINADEMAAACATACHADALVFLTDVPGVKGANGEVLRWLSIDQIAEMAKSAIISGGMLPKLSACREALLNGVKRVRILPAEAAASLPDLCSSRVAHGTEVMVA